MGRGRDFRGPRRRGFNDDDFPLADVPDFGSRGPFRAPPPMAEGPQADAVVKWFNGQKGFGFVELADGTGGGFLHFPLPQAGGAPSVPPGGKMRVSTTP